MAVLREEDEEQVRNDEEFGGRNEGKEEDVGTRGSKEDEEL